MWRILWCHVVCVEVVSCGIVLWYIWLITLHELDQLMHPFVVFSGLSVTHFVMWYQSILCPSPTEPNLLPNEDESTNQVCSGSHSWSFQSIPIHSNSVPLMRVGSAGEYESFEDVQKLRVASANKFHSCLCPLKTCSYRVCRTAYVLYSSHSHYILTVFCWLFLLYTKSFVHVGETGA